MQSTFAAMLMGTITMPPPPAGAVRFVTSDQNAKYRSDESTWEESARKRDERNRRQGAEKEAANRKAILEAIAGRCRTIAEMCAKTGLSDTTVLRHTEILEVEGLIACNRSKRPFVHTLSKKHPPDSYSIGLCHTGASGNDPIPEAGKAVIEGEVV